PAGLREEARFYFAGKNLPGKNSSHPFGAGPAEGPCLDNRGWSERAQHFMKEFLATFLAVERSAGRFLQFLIHQIDFGRCFEHMLSRVDVLDGQQRFPDLLEDIGSLRCGLNDWQRRAIMRGFARLSVRWSAIGGSMN